MGGRDMPNFFLVLVLAKFLVATRSENQEPDALAG